MTASKTLTLRWYCPGNGTKSITRPPCVERKRQLEKAGRGGDTNMLAYNCAGCQGPKKLEIPESISMDSTRPAGHEKSTTSGNGKARASSYPPAPPKTGDTPDARHGRQARGVVPACSIPPNTPKGDVPGAARHETQAKPGAESAVPGNPKPPPPRGADPESITGEASRGVSILEEPMADTPKCKHHPERPAVIRKDGQSMGVCRECLSGQASKAREKRKALAAARKAEAKLKPPPEPEFSPVLRESAPGPVETALSELLSQKAAELARALGSQQRAEITAAGWQVLALLEALQLTDRLPVPFTEPLKYPPEIKSASEFRDQGTWT